MTRAPADAGTLGAEIECFDLALRAERKSPKTRRTYCEAAAWLAIRTMAGKAQPRLITESIRETAGPSSWAEVTRHDVREHLAWLAETYSPAYVSNQFRALQAFFKWLETEEGIPSPMAGIKPPTAPGKVVPLIAPADLDKVLATITGRDLRSPRDKALFELFASSWARLGGSRAPGR